MKYILAIIFIQVISLTCAKGNEIRLITGVDSSIADFTYISNCIKKDSTLKNVTIVSVGNYDYVIDEKRDVISTYCMLDQECDSDEKLYYAIYVLSGVIVLMFVLYLRKFGKTINMFFIILTFFTVGISSCGKKKPKHLQPVKSNEKYTFGIDVSHYNGEIKWDKVKNSKHPISFVFIRSSMGKNGIDNLYSKNIKEAREAGFITGSYHYYRPNEKSTLQFENFCKNSNVEKGDLPPILDVERYSKYGARNLRKGILNWLKLTEEKYKIKPIIYTGRGFYNGILKGYVKDYPLWIASYTSKNKIDYIDWKFHQFTEKVQVNGIKGKVDGNDFNGDEKLLRELCIK